MRLSTCEVESCVSFAVPLKGRECLAADCSQYDDHNRTILRLSFNIVGVQVRDCATDNVREGSSSSPF
jgi:hypothetical protein